MAASAIVLAACSTSGSGRPPYCQAGKMTDAAARELVEVHRIDSAGNCHHACAYYNMADDLHAYCLGINEVYHGERAEEPVEEERGWWPLW